MLGEALMMTGAGIALGLAGALATTRLMQSLLFGVSSTDASFVSVFTMATSMRPSSSARNACRVAPTSMRISTFG